MRNEISKEDLDELKVEIGFSRVVKEFVEGDNFKIVMQEYTDNHALAQVNVLATATPSVKQRVFQELDYRAHFGGFLRQAIAKGEIAQRELDEYNRSLLDREE